jgi:hypothetical protein
LLDSAKGAAMASGIVRYEEGRFSSTRELKAEAESLVLAQAWAELEGLALTGAFDLASDTGLHGSGEVRAGKVIVAGAALHDLQGAVAFEGDAVKFTGLECRVFDGAVTSGAEVAALRSGFPMSLTAHVTGANLETLTREAQVPSLKLTGLADGDLAIAADGEGLKDLQLALQSTGPVSVSVALLEQLLASQYVKQFAGKQQLERVIAEIVGKEEQRPFDSAKVTLKLDGDRIAGQVALVSPKLNLTIDLQMDMAVVWQALKLAQEGRLKNVVNIQS